MIRVSNASWVVILPHLKGATTCGCHASDTLACWHPHVNQVHVTMFVLTPYQLISGFLLLVSKRIGLSGVGKRKGGQLPSSCENTSFLHPFLPVAQKKSATRHTVFIFFSFVVANVHFEVHFSGK